MGYAKRFIHDIFISYAHEDNTPDREGEKGWIDRFEWQLNTRLIKRFGEPVAVWRDPKLNRAQLYDQVIEKAVRGAGIFVPLITRRYLKSEYCKQEVDWFCEHAKKEPIGLTVDDYMRIFPVLLYNILPEDWPEVCRGLSAFIFHDAREGEFGETISPDSEAFGKQLRILVEELYTVLTRLKEQEIVQEKEKDQESWGRESEFRVFMACPADDLRPVHRQLNSALEHEGIQIISEIPPPYEEESHKKVVKAAMQRVNLSVHLLSASPGEPLGVDNQEKTFPLEQARLGLEHAQSQLILLPEEFDSEDIEGSDYAKFFQMLNHRPRDIDRLELIQTDRHQMLDELLAKKQRLLEHAARLKTETEGASTVVAFIDLHINDVIYAADLVSYLSQHKITPVMIPAADLSPAFSMSLFEENLRKSQLFIVVFGAVARYWVEHRLNEAFKLILSNHLPTQIGVYVAPPRKSRAEVKFPPFFEVMVNMDQFDPLTLDGLLQKAPVE